MQAFEYVGQLPSGTAISGAIEAESLEHARALLAGMQVHVNSIAAAPSIPKGRPLSREDLLYFNQQLASLASGGVALDRGLRMMASDLRRGRLRSAVESLAAQLERGIPLEEAAAQANGAFPPLYCEVLRAGAKTGRLGEALLNLSQHLSLMESARRAFWEAATYPLAIFILSLAVLSFFMITVVPQFEGMLADAYDMASQMQGMYFVRPTYEDQAPLPLVTSLVLRASRQWVAFLAGFAAVCAALVLANVVALRMNSLASLRESILLSLPWFKRLVRANLVARFAQAAALGARAGWDLPGIVRAAADATGSPALRRDALALSRHIEQGGLPEQSAMQTRLIPPLFGYTAQIAGGRGQLAPALAEMARDFDAIAQHHYRMLRGTLGPLFILVTAIVIGFLIVAMFSPLGAIVQQISSLVG